MNTYTISCKYDHAHAYACVCVCASRCQQERTHTGIWQGLSRLCVQHDWFLCDMTHICLAWLISIFNGSILCVTTHSHVIWHIVAWHDISVCSVTHLCITWLIYRERLHISAEFREIWARSSDLCMNVRSLVMMSKRPAHIYIFNLWQSGVRIFIFLISTSGGQCNCRDIKFR